MHWHVIRTTDYNTVSRGANQVKSNEFSTSQNANVFVQKVRARKRARKSKNSVRRSDAFVVHCRKNNNTFMIFLEVQKCWIIRVKEPLGQR